MEDEIRDWIKRKIKKAGIPEKTLPGKPLEKKEVKKEVKAKREGEIKRAPMKGSVDIEEKIEEYVEESMADKRARAIAKMSRRPEPREIPEPEKMETPRYPIPDQSLKMSLQRSPIVKKKRGLLTKTRILVAIIAGVVGALAGYLVYIYLLT